MRDGLCPLVLERFEEVLFVFKPFFELKKQLMHAM